MIVSILYMVSVFGTIHLTHWLLPLVWKVVGNWILALVITFIITPLFVTFISILRAKEDFEYASVAYDCSDDFVPSEGNNGIENRS